MSKNFRETSMRFWQLPLLTSIPCLLLSLLILASVSAELWINSRPLLVRYQGHWFVPVVSELRSGRFFGEDYDWEADYPTLQKKWSTAGLDHRVFMPLIAHGPLSIDLRRLPPAPPHADEGHLLGTDNSGRDVLARFIYGFRTALLMALAFSLLAWVLALLMATLSALGPPRLDLILQRIVEIWAHVPFIYVAIAMTSLLLMTKPLLVLIFGIFSWPGSSLYLRALLLQVKQRDYILAARLLGLSRLRIIFLHILPQIWPSVLTLLPFTLSAALVNLTSLDFLGFGLPPPEPSWGDLLHQAMDRPSALWMAAPVLVGLFVVLTAVTRIGEAIRNAQNPRQTHSYR